MDKAVKRGSAMDYWGLRCKDSDVDGVLQKEVPMVSNPYPPFDDAPIKVQDKLMTFEDAHEDCFLEAAVPCRKCVHLLKMAYQCHYGHMGSIGEALAAIKRDLATELQGE